MDLRAELPHLRVCLTDGSFLAFPLSERESFLSAWTGREAFWSAVDMWGERLHVKLAIVVTVCERTAAVLALIDAEDTERKARAMISGDAE